MQQALLEQQQRRQQQQQPLEQEEEAAGNRQVMTHAERRRRKREAQQESGAATWRGRAEGWLWPGAEEEEELEREERRVRNFVRHLRDQRMQGTLCQACSSAYFDACQGAAQVGCQHLVE